MTDDKGPVNIDIGTKLEVKTEIPSDAAGRLAHAVADVVSPLTEWLGLQGDKLRIHRMQVVHKLLQHAEEQVAAEQTKRRPIPLKIAIGLLEQASQEEFDDDFMIKKWAALLAAAATTDSVSPRFVSLLGELNGRQAALLTALRSPSHTSSLSIVDECAVICRGQRDRENLPTPEQRARIEEIGDQKLVHVEAVLINMPGLSQDEAKAVSVVEVPPTRIVDMDILESLGLIRFSNDSALVDGTFSISTKTAEVSQLGLELLKLTDPKTKE
jgi:hypothetical protein